MKLLSVAFALLFSFSTFAATVKVTSFYFIRNGGDPLAELCGLVEGGNSTPTFIRVLVDPKSNRQASYNTLAGPDGKFCLGLITYRGTAEVTLMEENVTTEAFIR